MPQSESRKHVREDLPIDTRLALLEQAFGTMADEFRYLKYSLWGLIFTLVAGMGIFIVTGGGG